MKKLNLLTTILFVIMTFGCKNYQRLNCSVDIENIKQKIISETDADSIRIYTVKVKEEIYFPTIKAPVIEIINPTMEILDFKLLPTENFERFDNFTEISDRLKIEGKKYALLLLNYCKMNVYNDLIIEFNKYDDNEKPCYRFICHYDELLN